MSKRDEYRQYTDTIVNTLAPLPNPQRTTLLLTIALSFVDAECITDLARPSEEIEWVKICREIYNRIGAKPRFISTSTVVESKDLDERIDILRVATNSLVDDLSKLSLTNHQKDILGGLVLIKQAIDKMKTLLWQEPS